MTDEIELKLSVAPERAAAVRQLPLLRRLAEKRALTRQLSTVYFDTPDRALAKRGIALRIRGIGRRRIQTIKLPSEGLGGLQVQREIETPVAGDRPELDKIADLRLRRLFADKAITRRLAPLFVTEFRRTVWPIRFGESLIELAFDEGEIRAKDARLPLSEIELELRSGRPEHLFELALAVHDSLPVTLGGATKAARGYALAEGVFEFEALAQRIGALDLKVPAAVQNAMMADIAEVLRRLGLWFVVQVPASAAVGPIVATYSAGFAALKGRFSSLVSALERDAVEGRIATLKAAGVPDSVAEDVGVLPLLAAVPEIVLLAERRGVSPDAAAAVYFALGGEVGLDRLRKLAADVPAADHWDRLALRRIVDDLYSAQRRLSEDVLAQADGLAPAVALRTWMQARQDDIGRTLAFLSQLEEAAPSVAKLSLANSQIQKIVSETKS